MNQHEIMTKLSGIKGNLQHIIGKRVHRLFKSHSESYYDSSDELSLDEGTDNYVDDLPLTLTRDPSPGIKYYSTENSEFARGAEREPAQGIDSFGEDDTFDMEDNSRRQNSDLAKRFYTNGLDLEDLNK